MIKLDKILINHVMIDLETLGTNNDSVILSAGVVVFNLSGKIESKRVIHFDIDSCIKKGLTVTGDTIKWWLSQSDDARMEITDPYKSIYSLEHGLTIIKDFIDEARGNIWSEEEASSIYVWGNSASFDLGILKNAFNAVNVKVPWEYYEEMDMRTITSLLPRLDLVFEGTPHNPLDDCYYQIKQLSMLLKGMGKEKRFYR